MTVFGNVSGIRRALLGVLLLLLLVGPGCDSGGGMNGGNGDDNQAPTATLSASPTEAVVGDTVQLDASDSSDPDGDDLSFSWSMESPDTSAVSVSDQTSEKISFVADVPGEFIPEVTVSDGNGGSDTDDTSITAMQDEPDKVTVTTETVNEDGSRIDTAAISYDGTTVSTGFVQKSYEKDANKTLSVEVGGDGLTQADTTIGLGSSHDLEFVLRKEVPDQSTIEFSNTTADADSSATGTWTWNGTEIVSGTSGTHTVPGSNEPGELCFQETDLFLQQCKSVTPNQETVSVLLEVQRKSVELAVSFDLPYGDPTETDVTVYEPYRRDSTQLSGEQTVELPKLSEGLTREVAGNLITSDPDNSSKLDRLVADESVSANTDVMLTAGFSKLPACSDGLDNDGDAAADKADTIACTDMDGNYDPSDDNEVLNGHSRVTGRLFDDSVSVSKTAGKRVAEISAANNPLPWSVTVAKGEISHRIEVQRSDTIPNQPHATHLNTGASNDNLTVEKTSDVVADADTANGFVLIRVHGIDRTFFADGPYYAVYGWHGCKALGNCGSIEGSGRFYYYAELSDSHLHSWSYVYEPEEVPKDKQQSISKQAQVPPATLKSGECKQVSETDEVCRVPAGSKKF